MKKILKIASLVALLLPAAAFAAFDDVSLTTDAVFTANGVTLNVSGSTASVESVVVNTTDLVVTLASGSTLTITANGNTIGHSLTSGASYTGTFTCGSATSQLAITATGASIVTISPDSAQCAGSGGGSGGGGGGGGGAPPPVTPPAATTTKTTPAVSANVSALIAQLQSLIAKLKSLGGTVSPTLEATIASFTSTAPKSPGAFMRDLSVGMTGDDVKAIQEFLNTHGYPIAASGPGSKGNETNRFGGLTRAALAKFQKDKGISPAAGFLGPKTRAAINAMK